MNRSDHRIAIVGGGASGVITAHSLISHASRAGIDLSIALFEPAELGAGLAYRTSNPIHLLNVPVERMSISESNPHDFLNWLRDHAPDSLKAPTFPFVSRCLYRIYLQDHVRNLLVTHAKSIEIISKKIESITRGENRWTVKTDCQSYAFDQCILATGYAEPSLHLLRIENEKLFSQVSSSYSNKIPAQISDANDVAILGMGLTAIDTWQSLRASGFAGKIHFFSRRGILPHAHLKKTVSVDFEVDVTKLSPRRLVRFIRNLEMTTQHSWPDLADALRRYATPIWQSWNATQRSSFYRHLRPYWEVIRHRVPSGIHEAIILELEVGRCALHRGRNFSFSLINDVPYLNFDNEGRRTSTAVAHVFVAAGVEINSFTVKLDGIKTAQSLLKIGFESAVDEENGFYIVGPPAKARLWEITAVPDIRKQIERIVANIIDKLA